MSEPKHNEKQKEKIVLHSKVLFEIVKKRTYNEELDQWDEIIEIKINDKKYVTIDIRDFDDILEHLTKKIDVLKYILDDTYDAVANDILFDIALIIYKLSKNDTV